MQKQALSYGLLMLLSVSHLSATSNHAKNDEPANDSMIDRAVQLAKDNPGRAAVFGVGAAALALMLKSQAGSQATQGKPVQASSVPNPEPAQRPRALLAIEYKDLANELPTEEELRKAYAVLELSRNDASNDAIDLASTKQQTKYLNKMTAAITNKNPIDEQKFGALVQQVREAQETIFRYRRLAPTIPEWRRGKGHALNAPNPVEPKQESITDDNAPLNMQTAYRLLGVQPEDGLPQAQIIKHHLIARHALALIRASENHDENAARQIMTLIQRTQQAYEFIASRDQFAREVMRPPLHGNSIHEHKNGEN